LSELARILENFCRLDGVQGALVVGPDGSVVEQFFTAERDSEALASLVLRSAEVGGRIAQELGTAPVNQTYVEYGDQQLTSEQLAGGQHLVILASSGANLGRIRLEIRKNGKAVEALLG
jgi:predicted regulator of Ras-like GTPase activity (Roadblock/LC7/MglB family)